MSNKKYKLNINDEEVELFSKYLGYWNPEECDIWFIWNEERLKNNEENVLDRLEYNELKNNNTDILKREKNDWFFTKECFPYEIKNNILINPSDNTHCHKVYQEMYLTSWEELKNLFISELFFLPAMNWKELWKKYKTTELEKINKSTDFYDRIKFYRSTNELFNLLENRIKYIFSFLTDDSYKKVYIYSFWDVLNNLNLIKEVLKLWKIENCIDENNHYIFFYKSNLICIRKKIEKWFFEN